MSKYIKHTHKYGHTPAGPETGQRVKLRVKLKVKVNNLLQLQACSGHDSLNHYYHLWPISAGLEVKENPAKTHTHLSSQLHLY